jgi:small neutral amino acid transporter SnatA (MarC family)
VPFFQLALTFFIVTNPIGNIPPILALLKDYDLKRQQRILIREGIISFLIALFFQYFGELFLSILNVKDYALTLTGGMILLIIAIGMIFPKASTGPTTKLSQEPFIVPIATPLLSGAGVLSLIMLFSKEEQNAFKVSSAIVLAWIGVVAVLALAPLLQQLLGKRGMLALEQLMGMVLAIIACGILIKGFTLFSNTLLHT